MTLNHFRRAMIVTICLGQVMRRVTNYDIMWSGVAECLFCFTE